MSTDVMISPDTERVTLGCDCESPAPEAPRSALCADCGLVYLTAGEYSDHLARQRAALDELLARVGTADAGEPVGDGTPDVPRRRRWRRRALLG